jgi:hypothetical protein
VSTGPLARVFVVRIGQCTLPPGDATPLTRVAPEGPTDFEQELEEAERRFGVATSTDDSQDPDRP